MNNDILEMDIQETDEQEYEGFVIDDEAKANWAIKTIKENNERTELYIKACEHEIQELMLKIENKKKQLESDNGWLLFQLNNYLKQVPTKRAKNSESFELPAGTIRRHYKKYDIKQTKELIELLKDTEFVEMTPKLLWGEYKKGLQEQDGIVIDTRTGEVAVGVELEERQERIEVK